MSIEVGDKVQMPGVPVTIEVLELGTCDEDPCEFGGGTFRFKDPESGEDDWLHVSQVETV